MTNAERDEDMIVSIEMWLHEIEPKWVEKELAWLKELRTRLFEEEIPNDLEEAAEKHASMHPLCNGKPAKNSFIAKAQEAALNAFPGQQFIHDRCVFRFGYEQATQDILALIESRLSEIIGDAQPKPALRAELEELIKRIKEDKK